MFIRFSFYELKAICENGPQLSARQVSLNIGTDKIKEHTTQIITQINYHL